VGAIFAGVFFAIFLGFLFGWVIKFLWNYTLADMFDWPPISYWQAVGVFILAKFFFGFGHSGGRQERKRKKNDEREAERVRQWWRHRVGMATEPESNLAEDALFKKYWQEEGKTAYEAYVAARRENPQSDAER
jgi:hypothetical protein